MSPQDFWHGDACLVRAYRRAAELNRARKNEELWWQGLYIYEALCCASPLFRAFGKKGAKAAPYPKEPHDIAPKRKPKSSERSEEKRKMLRARRQMEAFMAAVNAKRRRKEESTDGRRNDDRQPENTNSGVLDES